MAEQVDIPAHWTTDDVLADYHARYHCEAGNMLYLDECGFRCEFWDVGQFLAEAGFIPGKAVTEPHRHTWRARMNTPAEILASLLYEMNGSAWYGRDLGPWDGLAEKGEQWRWLEQAAAVERMIADRATPHADDRNEAGDA